jgi:hypothetical protein
MPIFWSSTKQAPLAGVAPRLHRTLCPAEIDHSREFGVFDSRNLPIRDCKKWFETPEIGQNPSLECRNPRNSPNQGILGFSYTTSKHRGRPLSGPAARGPSVGYVVRTRHQPSSNAPSLRGGVHWILLACAKSHFSLCRAPAPQREQLL